MVICISHQRQHFIILNSAQQSYMLQSARPFSGINVPDLKQVKCIKNMLEFVRTQKFCNYCSFGILGIFILCIFFCYSSCGEFGSY